MVAVNGSEYGLSGQELQKVIDAFNKIDLENDGKIDSGDLNKLCKEIEGKIVPFDVIHAARKKANIESKTELEKDDLAKLIGVIRGKFEPKVNNQEFNTSRSRTATVQQVAGLSNPSSPKKVSSTPSENVKASPQMLNSGNKKITRITGATDSTSHSMDDEELEQFALHANAVASRDGDLKHMIPISGENFFESCRDGMLLCKLINDSAPETIDERVLNVGKNLNAFQKTENNNLAINSAKAIGCSVVNIGSQDLIEGREHLVLGLVWQIIKLGLLAKVNLQLHPELYRLLLDGEALEDFLKLPADVILLRWFNYQLKRSGSSRRVGNFTNDLADSEAYLQVLHVLCPEKCPKTQGLQEDDLEKRADFVVNNAHNIGCDKYVSVGSIIKCNAKLNLAFIANLFNHYPGLAPLTEEEMAELDEKLFNSQGDRESRTFALWMNSLGVEPFVTSITDDLRDGRVLLQVIEHIKPNAVPWARVTMKDQVTRFKALENTNMVVELCKSFKFSLVGIQGADLTDGSKKLTLAIVWQLMRQHIIETLKVLTKDGKEINDQDIIDWANDLVKSKDSETSPINSFKDEKLKDGRFILQLLSAMKKTIVNFDLVTAGESEDDARMNAKYSISVARKLGASIFLLPEDITEIQPKMLMTFLGSLMAIHLTKKSSE